MERRLCCGCCLEHGAVGGEDAIVAVGRQQTGCDAHGQHTRHHAGRAGCESSTAVWSCGYVVMLLSACSCLFVAPNHGNGSVPALALSTPSSFFKDD